MGRNCRDRFGSCTLTSSTPSRRNCYSAFRPLARFMANGSGWIQISLVDQMGYRFNAHPRQHNCEYRILDMAEDNGKSNARFFSRISE